jgi:hypothetical protein
MARPWAISKLWDLLAIFGTLGTALQILKKRPDCKDFGQKDPTVNDLKRTKRKREKK